MSTWNQSFPGKNAITSIAKIKISLTLSTKTLRNLAQSVQDVTGTPMIVSEKKMKNLNFSCT